MDDGGVLTVKIAQSHGVYLLGRALDSIEIGLVERERSVRDDMGLEAEVASCACCGFHGVVGANPDNDE